MAHEIVPVNSPQLRIEEVLSLKEAADMIGVSYRGITAWILAHPDFKTKYIRKEKHTGRVKFVIDKSALVFLTVRRNGTRSNQYEQKEAVLHFAEQRQEIAEKHFDIMTDPIIQMRREQLEMQIQLRDQEQMKQDIVELRQELDVVRQLALETPSANMTNAQREFLNERVRNYSIQTSVTFSFVWSKVHAAVNKRSINDYEFGDYKPAIQRLKLMYQQANLGWE